MSLLLPWNSFKWTLWKQFLPYSLVPFHLWLPTSEQHQSGLMLVCQALVDKSINFSFLLSPGKAVKQTEQAFTYACQTLSLGRPLNSVMQFERGMGIGLYAVGDFFYLFSRLQVGGMIALKPCACFMDTSTASHQDSTTSLFGAGASKPAGYQVIIFHVTCSWSTWTGCAKKQSLVCRQTSQRMRLWELGRPLGPYTQFWNDLTR